MFELEFNKFTEKYDFNDINIKLKYNHSYRVRNLCLKYAHILNLSKEDTRLIEFIGLYHDIGRFTQLEKYHTYDDSKSIDHAEEGINVLFEMGLINKFDFNEEEKEIIKFAILNHNKFSLEEVNDKRKMLHAKLIRDLDKLDIIYLFAYLNELEFNITCDKISDEIVELIKNHKCVRYSDSPNIEAITYFGYVFDINYDECIDEFILYINELYRLIEKDNIFKEIYTYTMDYLESRRKYVR